MKTRRGGNYERGGGKDGDGTRKKESKKVQQKGNTLANTFLKETQNEFLRGLRGRK